MHDPTEKDIEERNKNATMQDFYGQYGFAMVEWCRLELLMKKLLAICAYEFDFGSESLKPVILTSGLSPRDVSDALHAFANDVFEGDKQENLKHAAKYYDILSVYRNYYVHGISSVRNPDLSAKSKEEFFHPAAGIVNYIVSKTKISNVHGAVMLSDLDYFIRHIAQLQSYSQEIYFQMIGQRGVDAPWHDKPALPKSLEKPRLDTPRRIHLL